MIDKNISEVIEIEKGCLYWIIDASEPKCTTSKAFYFCIDENLIYEDFGPLNLSNDT